MKICFLFNRLWGMFKYVSKDLSRIDRDSEQAIEVKIANACQKLPIEMDSFWSSSNNKMQLQQMFIDWFISTSTYHIPVYLGKWFILIQFSVKQNFFQHHVIIFKL